MAGEGQPVREAKPLSRSAESLGWLAQSGVQPKKRREIEGVSGASMVALKAEVFKTQQEAAAVKEGRLDADELRARRKGESCAISVFDRADEGMAFLELQCG